MHGHVHAGAGDPVPGQAVDVMELRAPCSSTSSTLSDHGDTEATTRLLRQLDDQGTRADRQRALFTSAASTPAFTTALARETRSGYEPDRSGDAVRVQAKRGQQLPHCPWPPVKQVSQTWGRERNNLGRLRHEIRLALAPTYTHARGNGFPLLASSRHDYRVSHPAAEETLLAHAA